MVFSRLPTSHFFRKDQPTLFTVSDFQRWLQCNARRRPWKWQFFAQKQLPVPYYVLSSAEDSTLVFESRFECGNLLLAAKVTECEYKLMLQSDSLTSGNTQCRACCYAVGFYFTVSNARKGQRVRFHIMNLAKKDLLYSKGMKIALFSKASMNNRWFRGGEDIEYTANKHTNSPKQLHILSFTYEFLHDDDTVSMAFAEPYTFTQITSDITSLEKSAANRLSFTRESLCTTIGGCVCELLTLTSSKPGRERRKAVVLTARVHPGETVGSWMLKGVLDFLTSGCAVAELLLDKCVFKVVPCLNPDGVVQGNYRCSLAGADLNRKYAAPSSVLHPSVCCLKQVVKNLGCPVVFYCDLHGHSKKKDVFAYGNNGEFPYDYHLFPYLLSKLNKNFAFSASRFSVSKAKASTARVAMWRELRIPAVYTIEASFFGPSCENRHFTPDDLVQMGESICQALRLYLSLKDPSDQRDDMEVLVARRIAAELKVDLEASQCNKDDSGSDSNSPENEADIKEIIKMTSMHKSMGGASEMKKTLAKIIAHNSNPQETLYESLGGNSLVSKIPMLDDFTVQKAKLYNRKKVESMPLVEKMQESQLKWSGLGDKMQDILSKKATRNKQSTIFKSNVDMYKKVRAKQFNIKNTQVTRTNLKELLNNPYKGAVQKNVERRAKTRNAHQQSAEYSKKKDFHLLNLSEIKLPKDNDLAFFKYGRQEPPDKAKASRNYLLPSLELNSSSVTFPCNQ